MPQLLPGQELLQYLDTFTHQSPNSKHFRFSGNPAFKKHDTFCTAQAETAFAHELWSLKSGSGLEHHFPHLYSQVGAGGVTVTVEVQRDTVVEGFEVVDGFEVVEGFEVVDGGAVVEVGEVVGL